MSARKKVKMGASRRRRKYIARNAEKFNRLLAAAHDIKMAPHGSHAEKLSLAGALEKRAHDLWEKIQKDVRRRTKRRKSPFDSRKA